MAKNQRKTYGEIESESPRCVFCGCEHFEYFTRARVKNVTYVTRKCRACGNETVQRRTE